MTSIDELLDCMAFADAIRSCRGGAPLKLTTRSRASRPCAWLRPRAIRPSLRRGCNDGDRHLALRPGGAAAVLLLVQAGTDGEPCCVPRLANG